MKLKSLLSLPLVFAISTPSLAQINFMDSFETRDLSANVSPDFTWEGMNRTSLVSKDPILGDLIIFNRSGAVELQQTSDKGWSAKAGDVSMRFDFPAGKGTWSEQRFSLAMPQEDIWIRYWLKVPTNFKHGSGSPSNNKLFALWMDDYSHKGAGPTVIWEFWNDGSGGSRLAYHYSPGGHKVAGGHNQEAPFIQYPADQGRWMQIVMHVKAATGPSANDGIIQLYRRWDGEESFTLLHDDQKANIAMPAGGPAGWKAGYFMGWSNPGYEQATEWLMDDLVISNSNLLTNPDSMDGPSGPLASAQNSGAGASCSKSNIPSLIKPA
ncbi:hypothetical protein ACXYTJ_01910 [Gilvimarinus sp. F26214L]|uniref:hypothetical protein n=1 Tax=Gilvimarinus sp. DZF01 TaxID=3461371 RepID=UPI004045503C